MHARLTNVQQLAAMGMNRSAIARELGVHRHTARKYLAYESPPERRHYTRQASMLAPYEGYPLARWRSGRRNAMQRWREIVAQGYAGSYRDVSRVTGYLRRQERTGCAISPSPARLSPAQAAGILGLRPENRTDEEQATLARLPALQRRPSHVGYRSPQCSATGVTNIPDARLTNGWERPQGRSPPNCKPS